MFSQTAPILPHTPTKTSWVLVRGVRRYLSPYHSSQGNFTMLSPLRTTTNLVAALLVFGWSVVSADSGDNRHDHRRESEIVLQAMPEIPHRAEKRERKTYRSPFIIPISAPVFGNTSPSEVDLEHSNNVRPPAQLPHRFHASAFSASETFHDLESGVPIARWNSFGLRHDRRWASRIVYVNDVRSMTVSVPQPNVKRIAERITRHNLSLSVIEDQLSTREAWTLGDLDSLMSQLQSHDKVRRMLSLYWRLLEPKDQWRAGRLASYDPVAELFHQRIFETMVVLDISPQAVSSLERDTAKARLAELIEELAMVMDLSELKQP